MNTRPRTCTHGGIVTCPVCGKYMGEREAAAATPPQVLCRGNCLMQHAHRYAAATLSLPCAYCDSPDGSKWHRPSCVEAAATPPLDVERLARAIAASDGEVLGTDYMMYARQLAAEYARLDEGSATPTDSHDLPGHKAHECHICGNWTEGSATPEQKRSLDSIVREMADLSVADSSEFRDPTWEDAVRALIRRARASFDEGSATPDNG